MPARHLPYFCMFYTTGTEEVLKHITGAEKESEIQKVLGLFCNTGALKLEAVMEDVPRSAWYVSRGTELLVHQDKIFPGDSVRVCLRCVGGKGGYGNTLRALGRKGGITDNVGDCRDLQGRRLRDVEAAKRASELAERKRAREGEHRETQVARKAATTACHQAEVDELKNELSSSRQRCFQENATASVASGLAKAGVVLGKPSSQTSHKEKVLKAFEVSDDEDSSSSDGDDSTALNSST